MRQSARTALPAGEGDLRGSEAERRAPLWTSGRWELSHKTDGGGDSLSQTDTLIKRASASSADQLRSIESHPSRRLEGRGKKSRGSRHLSCCLASLSVQVSFDRLLVS